MNSELRLELPFYTQEAVAKFVAGVTPVTGNATISVAALRDPRVGEALNAALKFSVESTL